MSPPQESNTQNESLKYAVLLIGLNLGAIAHAKASKDEKCVQVGAYKGLPSRERKTLEDVNCEQRRKLLNSAAATQKEALPS